MQNMKRHIGRLQLDLWQAAFGVLLSLCILTVFTTFDEYGISSDEHLTVAYGKAIYNWYMSGFQDQSVFHSRNTWLYGGFLNLVVHIVHKIVGGNIYDVSPLCNALVGLSGIVAAYRIGVLFGGTRAGFLAALFLLFTPRYYGHIFNNPRDIPFAVFYLWSIYFLLKLLLVGPSWKRLLQTGLAIGLTLGIRAGGLVLWVYAALSLGIQWWLAKPSGKSVKRPLSHFFSIVGISYIVMSIFWPWAQVHPFSALGDALRLFSSFPDAHVTFFEGRYLGNDEIPRYYALKWLILTLPEFVIVSLCVGLFCVFRQPYKITLQWRLLTLSAIFPLVYAVISNTPLYDGLRHLLFTVPPLVILGALSIHDLLNRLTKQWQTACVILLILSMCLTGLEMILLHPYQYIYFNRAIAGGIENASHNYETDYWEHSYKAGVQWIETHDTDIKRIGSFYDSVENLLNTKRSEFVRPEENPDYYLGTTRYDRHRIIPGKIIHKVEVKSVPLLYVIRPDSTFQNDPFFQSVFRQFYLAGQHIKKGDLESAISAYEHATTLIPGKEKNPAQMGYTYLKIGNLHSELKRYNEAVAYYEVAIEQYPNNSTICATAYNNIGLMYAYQKDYLEAITWYKKAAKRQPDYTSAYENVGDAYANMEQIDSAIDAYSQALSYSPEDPDLLHKYGMFCYLQNRPQNAVHAYRKFVGIYPKDVFGHYHLGIALAEQGDSIAAIKSLGQALEYDPDYFDAQYFLGKLFIGQNNFFQAESVMLRAVQLRPNAADVYNDLGVTYVQLDRYEEAISAFARALELNPAHTDARQNLEILAEALK
jgi:tetratricopeptide (TPR) repeat protein